MSMLNLFVLALIHQLPYDVVLHCRMVREQQQQQEKAAAAAAA